MPSIKYTTLRDLLGKKVADPEVTAVFAKAGKVTIKSDFAVAKAANFEFSVERKVLTSLFLRAGCDLPAGFAFGPRADLLAALPEPGRTWKIGPGKVPVETKGVSHDRWTIDGYDISANYRDDVCTYLNVAISQEAVGSDLSTHPLHFETRPVDAPEDAELVGMALLVAWSADRHGLPAKHASSVLGKELAKRAITPRAFLVQACGKTLTSLDVAPKVVDFLDGYTNRMFLDSDKARSADDKAITKLLGLKRRDERAYTDDFLATFASVVDNPFYVPDSWKAVDRIAPILDVRFADHAATGFTKPADLAAYKTAVKLRDSRAIEPARAQVVAATADATLADDLVALVGMSLVDKHVKGVLGRAKLPVGKKIDEQANPALGVSYLGTKLEIDGKRQLGIASVTFYASKRKSYIRGIGAEVEFVAFPGALPRGLAFGDTRGAVAKKLGKPHTTAESTDYWKPTKGRLLTCEFARDKLVEIYFGMERSA